jgi:hypothetical protein
MVALAPLAAPCAAAPAAARRCAGRATPCAASRQHAGLPAASARGARLAARRVAAARTSLVCAAAAQNVGAASSTAEAPAAAADATLGPGVRPLHILVAGGGIGGLVLAKGARRAACALRAAGGAREARLRAADTRQLTRARVALSRLWLSCACGVNSQQPH